MGGRLHPKEEGGLGIALAKDWNKAAMAKHVRELAKINSKSLWANWVNVNRLRRKSL